MGNEFRHDEEQALQNSQRWSRQRSNSNTLYEFSTAVDDVDAGASRR